MMRAILTKPAVGSNSLPAIAEQVRQAHADVEKAAQAAASRAIDAGRLLIEAKALLKHGEWQLWLREQTGLTSRTAQGYMQLARDPNKYATVAHLGLRAALAAVAKPRGEGITAEALSAARAAGITRDRDFLAVAMLPPSQQLAKVAEITERGILHDIRCISPNPFVDPRLDFVRDERVEELKRMIEHHNFWGGLVARPTARGLQLACGHRRLKAAIAAGITSLGPEHVYVREYSDRDMVEVFAWENLTQGDRHTDVPVQRQIQIIDAAVRFLLTHNDRVNVGTVSSFFSGMACIEKIDIPDVFGMLLESGVLDPIFVG